jgi:hypothetical protein
LFAGVEQTQIGARAGHPLLGRAAATEHAFEDDARIDLHR